MTENKSSVERCYLHLWWFYLKVLQWTIYFFLNIHILVQCCPHNTYLGAASQSNNWQCLLCFIFWLRLSLLRFCLSAPFPYFHRQQQQQRCNHHPPVTSLNLPQHEVQILRINQICCWHKSIRDSKKWLNRISGGLSVFFPLSLASTSTSLTRIFCVGTEITSSGVTRLLLLIKSTNYWNRDTLWCGYAPL